MDETDPDAEVAVPDRVPAAGPLEVKYGEVRTEGVVGRGGNAVVHEARVGDRRIALKEPYRRDDGVVSERFAREARTWAKLADHVGVLDVLAWDTDPHPWIALEYADGGSLDDREAPPVPEALWVAQRVAAAVHHAHRHGVAHLDLKPGNVLFRSVEGAWDAPRVADFGLARALLSEDDPEGFSPPYAAPEQFDPDRGPADDRTDVYQLGALCYRLLTGRPPYSGRPGVVVEAVLDGPPPAPTDVDPGLPPAVDDVVGRAMAPDRADRYESALDLRRDLETLLADLGEYDPESVDRELAPASADVAPDRPDPADAGGADAGGADAGGADAGGPDEEGTAVGGTDLRGRPFGGGHLGRAIDLERQGFVRLTPSYFERREPAPPVRAWRAGLRLVDVHNGYAVDRRVERDGDRVSLTDHLVDRLATGTDCAVVGPPGAGKSTALKSVACAWYAADRGPVFYRESGRGDRLDSPTALRHCLDGTDGHALVVVEDAVRPEAGAVFEAVEAAEGRSDVSFLLDARRSEWDAAGTSTGTALAGGRDRIRRRGVEVVDLPRPDRREYERFVAAVEATVEGSLDLPTEQLLAEIRGETADDERRPGELFLLLHRLLSAVDPLAGDPTSSLVESARRTCADLEERGDVALDVGVAANLSNAAGVGVHPELLHAVAPGDDAAVAEAVDAIEGRVVFPDGEATGPYRAVHEVWSVKFLARLIGVEGDRAAHERVGRVLTRILALADDPERRERVDWVLHGEAPYLDRVARDPGGWADAVVGEAFALGVEWPKLAPLFGKTGYSRIELPDACADGTGLRCTEVRGRAYRLAGDYDRAEREYERLVESAREGETGEFDPDRVRVRGLLGLAEVDENRGEYDAAVERVEAGLADVPDGSRERCRLLGVEAEAYAARGDHGSARETARRQRDLAAELGAEGLRASAVALLGVVARREGDHDRARECFEEALAVYREVGDRRGRADTLRNLAGVLFFLDEYDRARQHCERALAVYRDLGHRTGEVRTLGNLGLVAMKTGDYAAARERFETGLELARDLGDRGQEGKTLVNLGIVTRQRGEYGRARECFGESLSLARDVGDRRQEVRSLIGLGRTARRRGALDAARERFEAALETARDLDDRKAEGGSLADLGTVALDRGDHDRAAEYLDRGLDVLVEVSSPAEVAQVRLRRGRLALERGDPDLARERVERARESLAETDETYWIGRSRRLLGRVAAETGDQGAARDHLAAALSAFRSIRAPEDALATARELVETCAGAGEDDRAGEWSRRAREVLTDAPEEVADRHREWVERYAADPGGA